MVQAFNLWPSVTPSDAVDLPGGLTGALWVGGAGDVAAVQQNNVVGVLTAVPAGSWLPLTVRRINATGTTATNIRAFYQV
jgi:hypothetical protein